MNILILSVGTRCKLVEYFMKRENGFDKVITTDCSNYSPGLYLSDFYYIVPKITDVSYINVILNICIQENIKVILPLLEQEVGLIAINKKKFLDAGVFVVSSDLKTINICQDKYLLANRMEGLNIPCIKTYDYDTQYKEIKNLNMPVFVKERYGAGSKGTLKINSIELLDSYVQNFEEKFIVQPYYDTEEIGVDVYRDFVSGEIISIFAKKKIRMRAGETEKSISIKDDKIFEVIKYAVKKIGLYGPIDIDLFKYNGKYYILEINPRFGGGYPHAYECGENFIKFISNNARGIANSIRIGKYNSGLVMLKYTETMIIGYENRN